MEIMNHREMEYETNKLFKVHGIEFDNNSFWFSAEDEKANALMKWLSETAREISIRDIELDYGLDCIRGYLMFEKIPKPNDQEMDTWEESSLEGVYKFICKYYRAMTTIYHANRQGLYKNIDTELMMNSLTRCEFECLKLLHMNNTMPNRHNVMALLMDELKNISKVCKVGELTVKHHEEEINHANPNAGVIEVLEKDDNTNPGIDIVCKKYMTLVSPFVPYITEQAWKLYSQDTLAVEHKWEYNDLADEDIVSIPVQVNGKAKAVLSITRNTDADTVKSEAFKLVDRRLQDKDYKCIYVENKIINFVY